MDGLRIEEKKAAARKRAKEWHWKNRARANAASKKWYAENKEVAKARTLKWRAENKERARLNDARKRANKSPEYLSKRRVDEQNRRARLKSSGGVLSKNLPQILYEKQKGKCVYCHISLKDGFDMDHIMPIFLGGKNVDENIQLLCGTCNRSKHSKHPVDYANQIGLHL